jgi:hypothetical protein
MSKGKSDPNAVPASVNMPVTPELYAQLKAGAGTTAIGVYVHNLLATQYSTPLKPVVTGRTKWASEAEKVAVVKARKDTRDALIEQLMKDNADKFAAMLAEAEHKARAQLAGVAAS